MNNDDRKFSNNPSPLSGEPANRQGNEVVENKRATNWRTLGATMTLIVLLIGVAVYFSLTRHQSSPTVTPQLITPTPEGSPPVSPTLVVDRAEIPSLFPGLTIKQRQEGIVFKTEDIDGPVQIRGTEVEANIRSLEDARLALELVGYYNNYFTTRGWDFYLSASGPIGDLEGWEKEGKYFIFEYRIDANTGTRAAFLRYN